MGSNKSKVYKNCMGSGRGERRTATAAAWQVPGTKRKGKQGEPS